tara:strand:+ start:253 stop:495 length:243 start_codon:yes stop_codon:yes gene_type:complete
MEFLIIAFLIALMVTITMYLDTIVCGYDKSKAYFIKLFTFTFISATTVCYLIRRGYQIKSMLGGYGNVPSQNINPGLPNF